MVEPTDSGLMKETDDQRAVTEWLAARKGDGMKDTDALAARLHERWPLGALPFCANHRWVPEPNDTHRACARCGLTVAR